MDKISTPQKFFLNRDAVRVAIEAFKIRKTIDIVVEMLGEEMLGEEITPNEAMLPPSSIRANMELVMVNTNQNKIVPVAARGVPAFGGSSDVPIVRAEVSPDQSSLAEEVTESLKRKTSWLAQEPSTVPTETINKKRRLVKDSELVPSWKETSSSLPSKKSSTNKVGKCKGRECL